MNGMHGKHGSHHSHFPFSPSPLSTHVVCDLSGCCGELLENVARLEQTLTDCATLGGATVVSSHFHRFSPQGASGVVILAESHATIHTWPEIGYAAIDVFTCGTPEIARNVAKHICAALKPTQVASHEFTRQPPCPTIQA